MRSTKRTSKNLSPSKWLIILIITFLGLLMLSQCSCSTIKDQQMQHSAGRSISINQSVAYWGFSEHYSLDEMINIACDRGINLELIGLFHQGEDLYKVWDKLAARGLKDTCHYPYPRNDAFNTGLNNPKYNEMNLKALNQGIDDCYKYGFPNVIAFVGLRDGISYEDGVRNCVAVLNRVKAHAEKKKVNIVLEILNSKIDEPMKGHPGYQGDSTRFVREVITKVNSPHVLMLYDIYHTVTMKEDPIKDISQNIDCIGHFHTAGVPGRNELNAPGQTIDYRQIMELIASLGYEGHVTHEFIPAGADPLACLDEAIRICDVRRVVAISNISVKK